MHHLCTYFDRNYFLRGLTMYRSLKASGSPFTLHVLALDDETETFLRTLNLDDLLIIPLADLEFANPDLAQAKGNRSRIEYYFTLSPILPLYIFDSRPDIDLLTYVDADLYFYEDPEPIFEELGEKSILICEHRYSRHLERNAEYGNFNVQFQIFRRDAIGLTCLNRWKTQCLDWCHDRAEDGKYADQGYLDEWPSIYGDKLSILRHEGAGVAPWNWASSPIVLADGKMTIAGKPLVFYHFHGVKIFNAHFISNGVADWGNMPFGLARWFYAGYIRKLRETRYWLRECFAIDLPMKDNFMRGKGVNLSSLGEIARKAISQAMFIP